MPTPPQTPGRARFESAYEGVPPWDIGRPQDAFVALAQRGEIRGRVLDVGCGTGENALYFASLGQAVVGLDAVAKAIEKAREKAKERGLAVDFRVGDALALAQLGGTFDTIVDCGLFHTFTDEERTRYVASLRSALAPGGTLYLMCFSDEETREGGPRRVSQREIREAFATGFEVERIEPARFVSHIHEGGAKAWLATIGLAGSRGR
jgi:cyclopropane fatty-acyl-phospholipid synthase-like methyltransferase